MKRLHTKNHIFTLYQEQIGLRLTNTWNGFKKTTICSLTRMMFLTNQQKMVGNCSNLHYCLAISWAKKNCIDLDDELIFPKDACKNHTYL